MNLSERIKSAIKARNDFSLSHDAVLTCDWGDIVPINFIELVPTDKITAQGQVFIRLAEMISPCFGRMHGFVNHFFVPTRILMPENKFEDSITGGSDGTSPAEFPFVTYRVLFRIACQIDQVFGSLASKRMMKFLSYLGLGWLANAMWIDVKAVRSGQIKPTDAQYWENGDDVDHSVSLLPFLAYARIYGDYYFPYGLEEDDLVKEVLFQKRYGLYDFNRVESEHEGSGMVYFSLIFSFVSACYSKDYFTTAFTQPQRGLPSIVPVSIASGSLNPGLAPTADASAISAGVVSPSGDKYNEVFTADNGQDATTNNNIIGQFTAHMMKYAENIQSFMERNNIAGGRYFEQMLARFGVKLKSAILQRSEYLGGSDFWVSVQDVTSHTPASSSDRAGLGLQAGKGIALGKQNVEYTAEEYGFFISLFHLVPESGIVDGLERMWTRHDKFDYWQPETEDNGFRPIYNKEVKGSLTFLGQGARPNGVFGYVPQYAEYKFASPVLGGDFILGDGVYSDEVLNSMHLYRRMANLRVDTPVLNTDFVRITPREDDGNPNNFNRIFQNTSADFDHFIVNVQFSLGANRPMIGYAEAGMEYANNNGSGSVAVPYGGVRL